MKILVDARLYGLENAGIGRYLINLVRELSKLDSENSYFLLLGKKYFNQLNLPKNFRPILADFKHYTFTEQLKLPSLITKIKPNLVHFPHFNIPILFRGKFVVTIHDMTMHRQGIAATILPLPLYYFKRLPYKYAFRKAVKSSSKIVVPTKSVKDEVVGYFGIDEDKVKVIYEGLDDKFQESIEKSGTRILRKYKLKPQNYFIYVGNVYPHKNIKRAIEAVSFLNRNRKKKFIFAIATSRNVFSERLKKQIKSVHAEKYVKFLGFISDEELSVLLKNSVAFIYPSLSEGFGLQGLESMAVGTLVLASDISVFKEVYRDNVLYFNPFDFNSIEKTMKEAVDMKKKERERIIKKGQKFIKRYSWTKMAKQTLRVYQEAVRIS